MVQETLPIGIFDSGVGGLTVASAVVHELPDEQILYFGDTARCPYGDRKPDEVLQFSIQVCDFLVTRGVKMLVVACNTATAAALPVLERRYAIPVLGVIEPGARAAVAASDGGHIGVIGTGVTVRSQAYEFAVKRLQPQAQVFSLACPEFVPMVESGEISGPHVESVVRRSLQPLLDTHMDTLILGCTHYPHLQSVIQSVVGPGIHLISSAYQTALQAKDVLATRGLLQRVPLDRPHHYYTTGDGTVMRTALTLWMGIRPEDVHVQTVDLQALTLLV